MPKTARFVVALAIAGCAAGVLQQPVRARQAEPRTVYVTVTDRKNVPVTDVDVSEFEVKADGKRAEIVSAAPATTPLRIALIVSDAGTGGFQAAAASLMQKLLGRAEFSLISLIVQPETITGYTGDAAALRDAVKRVGIRGRQVGAQLMETIRDTTKNVRREGTRPVIIVMRVGAETSSTLSADEVRDDLRKSGAILYVVSTMSAERRPASSARPGISTEQAQMQDDEMTSGMLSLGQVLGDGARDSGGRHTQVVSTTLIPALEGIAEELVQQYALTYKLPDGAKAGDKLQVTTKRKNVTLRAATKIAN